MKVRIASLHCYPLKSGRGLELEQAQLTPTGILNDRRWMVVSPTGRFLTQRELPLLALVKTEVQRDAFILCSRGQLDLRVSLLQSGPPRAVNVWGHECPGLDEGDEAAAWLSQVLARECRLVRFDPTHERLSSRDWTGAIEARNQFSDGFPLLAIGQSSLDDLNARLGRTLPMNRFRPNIVLEGLGPYEEDRIDLLYDDKLTLKIVKPCTRCKITTTDQATAQLDGDEPLRTLKSYRWDAKLRGVLFGQNTIIVRGVHGTLRRGQVLEVRWKETASADVA